MGHGSQAHEGQCKQDKASHGGTVGEVFDEVNESSDLAGEVKIDMFESWD